MAESTNMSKRTENKVSHPDMQKKKLIQIVSLFVSFFLLFSTTSCLNSKDRSESDGKSETSSGSFTNTDPSRAENVVSEDVVYFSQKVLAPFTKEGAESMYVIATEEYEDGILLLVQTYFATDDEDERDLPMEAYPRKESVYLLTMNSVGEIVREIDLKTIAPDGDEDFISMSVSKDGTVLFVCDPSLDPESETNVGGPRIYKLNRDGKFEDGRIVLEYEKDPEPNARRYYYRFELDNENRIYAIGSLGSEESYCGIVTVFDENGKELFTIEDNANAPSDSWNFSSTLFRDGDVVYIGGYAYDQNSPSDWIAQIDLEKQVLGDRLENNGLTRANSAQSGNGGIFTFDETGIYSVSPAENKREAVVLFSDIDVYFQDLFSLHYHVLSRDKILAVGEEYDPDTQESSLRWVFLERESGNPNAGKQIIRVGGFGISVDTDIRKAIYLFNQGSKGFRAELYDYLEDGWTDEESYQMSLKRMNMEILSGDAPDILMGRFYDIDFAQLASRELFVDLYALMKDDPEYAKDQFFENLLEAAEVNGELNFMFMSFCIEALKGRESLLGDRTGWTAAEFDAFAQTLPSNVRPMVNVPQSGLFFSAMFGLMDQFVNEREGTVNFDSEEFKSLLNYCKKYGMTEEENESALWIDDYELMRNGELAVSYTRIYSVSDYTRIRGDFDEKMTIVGYPAGAKSGPTAFSEYFFAILKSSAHPSEAWECMKFYLGEEKQDSYMKSGESFPVRISSFEKGLERAMSAESAGDDETAYGYPEAPKPTQEDADYLRALIESIEQVEINDESIMNILLTEIAPFFSGDKTIEMTIQIIQDRVRTLINDRA